MIDLGDGGLGFQLSMHRLYDTIDGMAQDRHEQRIIAHANRVVGDYNRLLAYAQDLERKLKERDEQLARSRVAVASSQRQLEYEQSVTRRLSLNILDRAKERERERDLRKAESSQSG